MGPPRGSSCLPSSPLILDRIGSFPFEGRGDRLSPSFGLSVSQESRLRLTPPPLPSFFRDFDPTLVYHSFFVPNVGAGYTFLFLLLKNKTYPPFPPDGQRRALLEQVFSRIERALPRRSRSPVETDRFFSRSASWQGSSCFFFSLSEST